MSGKFTCPCCNAQFELPASILIAEDGKEIFVCPVCDHCFESGTHVGTTATCIDRKGTT